MSFFYSTFTECTMGLKYEATIMDDEVVSTLYHFFRLFLTRAHMSLFKSDFFDETFTDCAFPMQVSHATLCPLTFSEESTLPRCNKIKKQQSFNRILMNLPVLRREIQTSSCVRTPLHICLHSRNR